MINEGTVKGFQKTCEDMIVELHGLLREYKEIEANKQINERTGEILRQKENSIVKREVTIAEDKKDIERQKGIIGDQLLIIEKRKEDLKKIESAMEIKRTSLKEESLQLDKKRLEIGDLETRKKDIITREQEVEEKRKELYQKESDLQKETILLREKKDRLDGMEEELTKEKERIKSLIR